MVSWNSGQPSEAGEYRALVRCPSGRSMECRLSYTPAKIKTSLPVVRVRVVSSDSSGEKQAANENGQKWSFASYVDEAARYKKSIPAGCWYKQYRAWGREFIIVLGDMEDSITWADKVQASVPKEVSSDDQI